MVCLHTPYKFSVILFCYFCKLFSVKEFDCNLYTFLLTPLLVQFSLIGIHVLICSNFIIDRLSRFDFLLICFAIYYCGYCQSHRLTTVFLLGFVRFLVSPWKIIYIYQWMHSNMWLIPYLFVSAWWKIDLWSSYRTNS